MLDILKLRFKEKIKSSFKVENGFLRLLLVTVSVVILIQLFIVPTHFEFYRDSGFSGYMFYGLRFFHSYNIYNYRYGLYFEFHPKYFFPMITMIFALILSLLLAIKINKFNKDEILKVGIISTILFVITFITYIYISVVFDYYCFSYLFVANLLMILVYAILMLILTIQLSRKHDKPDKIKKRFLRKHQLKPSMYHVRMLFFVVSILLIVQFFIPTFISINLLNTPPLYYIYFFSGIIFTLDGSKTLYISFDPFCFFQIIPQAAALILIIILIIKIETLERKQILFLGIASAILLILSPILYFGAYYMIGGTFVPFNTLSCFNLHFIIFCVFLVLLGSIHVSNRAKPSYYNIARKLSLFLRKYRVEVVAFSIFFIYLYALRVLTPFIPAYENSFLDWDMYLMMSRDITSIFKRQIVAPFCYRPLIPLLAGILPFDLQTSYALIVFLSAYFTGILLYATLRLRFSKSMSLMGLLFFILLSYIPKASLISFGPFNLGFINAAFIFVYFVDFPAGFFLMACFYCIFSQRKKGYLICLLLGTLTKEIVFGTIPVFIAYEIMINQDPRNLKKMGNILLKNTKYFAPGICAYLLLRLIVVPIPVIETSWYGSYNNSDYGSIEMFLVFWDMRIAEIFYQGALYDWFIGVWSPMIIAFCCLNNWKRMKHWFGIFGIFMLFCYTQIFLGFATTRYIVFGFYPIIFLAVSGLEGIFNIKLLRKHYEISFIKVEISSIKHQYLLFKST
ncbi:MAG: hypothetical protein JW891_08675 [Candidatus Lokiarchaeota archaeon]|nr:hypothetical protein [Candidatus Lokiarchaeota archaeon]